MPNSESTRPAWYPKPEDLLGPLHGDSYLTVLQELEKLGRFEEKRSLVTISVPANNTRQNGQL